MTCAPSLLKYLGTKLSLAITKPKTFAEQRLFQAILVQALEDATNPSNFKRETYHKHDSHCWFVDNSDDFQRVCWGAELDPEFVRGEYLKMIDNGKIMFSKMQIAWIRYRALYKRYREAGSKEERREIRALILKENLKKLE
tara:strand:+ start:237 stop:659 length:423 start_codon:yes stop_codon:yes gene_type:complete